MKAIKFFAVAFATVALAACSNSQKAEEQNVDKADEATIAQAENPSASLEEALKGQVYEVDGNELPEVGDMPLVLDFNATWCGPCHQFHPVFEAAAEKYAGKAVFCSIDVDNNELLAEAYGVESIPYIVVVTGPENSTAIGYMNPEEFDAFLNGAGIN